MPQPGEDYYDDSATPPPAASPKDGAPKDDSREDDGGKTSILPRSFFSGKNLKVGDKCDVTVTAIHENDVEVEPCERGDDEEKDGEQPPESEDDSTPPTSDAPPQEGSMASMMS